MRWMKMQMGQGQRTSGLMAGYLAFLMGTSISKGVCSGGMSGQEGAMRKRKDGHEGLNLREGATARVFGAVMADEGEWFLRVGTC